jgi:catechol 2,3-dioxygenase-like lactoylglutathione lyase family enzyme
MQLEALTLTARDLKRARQFYAGKLGFTVLVESERSIVLDAGGVFLQLASDGARAPLDASEPRLAFRTTDLWQRCAALRDLGVSVEGPLQNEGGEGRHAELRDPDGHPITLWEKR